MEKQKQKINPQLLPIIDIGLLKNRKNINQLAQSIRSACTKYGFFYVKGHEISQQLIKKLYQLSNKFFLLPVQQKMKIQMKNGGKAWRGYFPVFGESTSGIPDNKQGLYFGKQLQNDNQLVISKKPLHGPNLFPQQPKQLKNVVLQYIQKVTQLGQQILSAIAISLQLQQDYFKRIYTNDPTILFRIFHYPNPQDNDQIKKQYFGVGQHTDYGLLTVLLTDDCQGLQVKTKQGWIMAPPINNTFICNIGDMLDRVTGGLYKSTPHRVINKSGRSRYSFPLFLDPGFDCLPQRAPNLQIQDNTPPRWDNANVHQVQGTYGQYLLKKIGKVFPQLKDQVL